MGAALTYLLIAGAVALLLGGGAGGYMIGTRPGRAVEAQAELVASQAAQLEALQTGQVQLLEQATQPVVLDAELRAELAQTPPACVEALGGDPLSAQCLLMACWQYGQSSAQRPDCDSVEALTVSLLSSVGTLE